MGVKKYLFTSPNYTMKPQSVQPLALVIYGIINCLCCRAWKHAGWVADILEYLMPVQRNTARGWQAKVVDNVEGVNAVDFACPS